MNIVAVNNGVSMLPVDQMKSWYKSMVDFGKEILQKDHDFGTIQGTPKPCLYQPGAEKLRVAYGLQVSCECIEKTEDLSIGLLDYTYKCKISTPNGMVIGDKDGSANSFEPNFRYIWVPEHEVPSSLNKAELKTKGGKRTEFAFAIAKAETTGQYGKPAEYWKKFQDAIDNGLQPFMKKASTGREMEAYEIDDILYRIQNPDIMGKKNTIQKIAQKRSFVAAILQATGASEFFTQDLEDFHDFSTNGSGEPPVVQPEKKEEPKKEPAKKESKSKAVKQAEPKKDNKTPFNADEVFTKYQTELNSAIGTEDLRLTFIAMVGNSDFSNLKEEKKQQLVDLKDSLKKQFKENPDMEKTMIDNLCKKIADSIKSCEDIGTLKNTWDAETSNPKFKFLSDDQKENLQFEHDTLRDELANDETIGSPLTDVNQEQN